MSNNKIVLFAFQGEAMCFVHVMLNAFEYQDKGYEVKIVIEGQAVKLVDVLNKPDAPFYSMYKKIKNRNLIDCVCKACASKMGVLKQAENQGLRLCDELSGHPSMQRYTSEGYQIITF